LSAPVPAVLMVSNSVFFQAAKPQTAGCASLQAAGRKRAAIVKNS
jgi:hypothetical protein